jgi:hypothetical protein
MTKKEIKIIQKREAELYHHVQFVTSLYNDDDCEQAKNARSRWYEVYSLMEDLGIESDSELKKHIEAVELIIGYNERKRAISG